MKKVLIAVAIVIAVLAVVCIAVKVINDKPVSVRSIADGLFDQAVSARRDGETTDLKAFTDTHFPNKEYKKTGEKGTPDTVWEILGQNGEVLFTVTDMKESWLMEVTCNGRKYQLKEIIRSVD